MAVIWASSVAFAAGLALVFLVAPRSGSVLMLDGGIVLIALGFAGLIGAVAAAVNSSARIEPCRGRRAERERRPRLH